MSWLSFATQTLMQCTYGIWNTPVTVLLKYGMLYICGWGVKVSKQLLTTWNNGSKCFCQINRHLKSYE